VILAVAMCAASAIVPHALCAQTATPAPAQPDSHTIMRAAPVGPAPAPPVATAAGPAQAPAPAFGAASNGLSADSVNGATYTLAPYDVVSVTVYQEMDLATTARVAKDGTINFPLIGTVSIAGKTPDDAARVIAASLAKDYLVNPQVSITVTEYSKRRFTVLGEVQKPGQYDMPDRDSVTLLEAIGLAGGYTRIADQSKIRLKRLQGGKEVVFKLNAKDMANERATASFEVQPGDIITVGESFF
jgi:polysaccharide export outer membrane protein